VVFERFAKWRRGFWIVKKEVALRPGNLSASLLKMFEFYTKRRFLSW